MSRVAGDAVAGAADGVLAGLRDAGGVAVTPCGDMKPGFQHPLAAWNPGFIPLGARRERPRRTSGHYDPRYHKNAKVEFGTKIQGSRVVPLAGQKESRQQLNGSAVPAERFSLKV